MSALAINEKMMQLISTFFVSVLLKVDVQLIYVVVGSFRTFDNVSTTMSFSLAGVSEIKHNEFRFFIRC